MSNMSETFPSSFELWEFVIAFEEGSLPAAACTEQALAAIAVWYLSMLAPSDAMQRLEAGLRRNHLRFASRWVSPGDGGNALADVWPCLLRRLMATFGANDPVAIANRLLPGRSVEARDRAA